MFEYGHVLVWIKVNWVL